jgi:hypothetical protein
MLSTSSPLRGCRCLSYVNTFVSATENTISIETSILAASAHGRQEHVVAHLAETLR